MTAHPLQEVHFESWAKTHDGPTDMIVRHLYHVPRMGDSVVFSEGDVTIRGRVFDVVWTGELVIVRVR